MYEEVIRRFKSTPGAISVTEAFGIILTLLDHGIRERSGSYVDIGSHAGKSSIPAALVLAGLRNSGDFFMVDPLYAGPHAPWERTDVGSFDNVGWIYAKEQGFQHQVTETIRPFLGRASICLHTVGALSCDFLKEYDGPMINYVFIDSADHSLELLREEFQLLDPLMAKGGLVLFHDYGNYRPPVIMHEELCSSGKYKNVPINWEKAREFCDSFGGEEGNNSWHMNNVPYPSFIAAMSKE